MRRKSRDLSDAQRGQDQQASCEQKCHVAKYAAASTFVTLARVRGVFGASRGATRLRSSRRSATENHSPTNRHHDNYQSSPPNFNAETTMSRPILISVVAMFAVAVFSVAQMTTGDTTTTARLAGAGAGAGAGTEIDASKYSTLQEAFDAVPATGGVVRIPPGEFVITEPLVMTRGDVLSQGSGGRSHIVNKNEVGKPASDAARKTSPLPDSFWNRHPALPFRETCLRAPQRKPSS